MFPKISFWLLLHLSILLAVGWLQSSEGSNYPKFQRQHINYPKTRAPNTNAYCNLMMKQRGMTRGRCKRINTFIINRPSDIKAICRGRGIRVRRNIFRSRRRFRLYECRNVGHYPNCRYTGKRRNKKIRVGCIKRLPVHLDGVK